MQVNQSSKQQIRLLTTALRTPSALRPNPFLVGLLDAAQASRSLRTRTDSATWNWSISSREYLLEEPLRSASSQLISCLIISSVRSVACGRQLDLRDCP